MDVDVVVSLGTATVVVVSIEAELRPPLLLFKQAQDFNHRASATNDGHVTNAPHQKQLHHSAHLAQPCPSATPLQSCMKLEHAVKTVSQQ